MDQLEVECVEEDYMGQIVIIKKDSTDGGTMPLLRSSSWTIGSDESCDLRIKNSLVRALHVKLTLEEKEDENFGDVYVFQYQAFGPIQLNAQAAPYVSQNPVTPGRSTPNKNQLQPKTVKHGDVFRVGGRAFRIEYPQGHHLRKRRRSSTMMPRKPSINFSPAARRRVDVMKTPTRVTKPFSTPMSSKRRVTFGNRLSPEIFDYRKPPDTPIRKGTTPAKKNNERKSILRDTPMRKPLVALREESMTVPKLDLGDDYKDMPDLIKASDDETHESPCRIQKPGDFSFDVDPDDLGLESSDEEPERVKKTPSIEQVLPENRTTPTTPADKRKARRKSSLFQPKSESSTPGSLTNELLAPNEDDSSSAADVTLGVISDFDISDDELPPAESTKVSDRSKMNSTAGLLGLSDIESKEDKEAEMTDEGASLNDTPKEFNLTEHPTTPLVENQKVTTIGSMRKKATTQSRVTTIRTAAARRRTCGASPNSGKIRVKRFSADPKFLANAIKMYGMKLMKRRLAGEPEEVVNEAMEILDKENKTPNKSCLPTPKMEKKTINIPTTPSEAINALPKPLMNNEIVVNRVEIDETLSPVQKALFQKDMTAAKEAPEVESIIEETAQTDDKRTHQNQEELDIKKNSEHKVVQNPVTPGPTAMKVLFAEETKAKGNQTPHQSAMKGLFKEEKEQQAAATPIQGELHQMFKEQKSLPTPNVRKIFSEMAQEMKTPDGKAMNNIFGDGKQKAEKEKTIPQNPVTPGGDAMTGLFGSKTPAVASTANIFESPARENKEENPFATPGRGTKFSDFADSAFKRDESKPKANEVTPGQTAMKAIFEPSIEPQSPLLDASAIRNVFQSPNGSLVDLENDKHVKSIEDITDDIKIGNTSIRQLIDEAGDMNATPDQIALEYLLEGNPIEIKFDDEMSTSTASLKRLSEGSSHRSRTRKSFIGKNQDEPNISTSLFTTPESDDDDEIKAEDKDILQLDASMALDKSQEKTDDVAPAEPKNDVVSEKPVSDVIAPRRRGRPSIKPKAGQELESPKKVGEPSNEEGDKVDCEKLATQTDETKEEPEAVSEISVTAATPKQRGRPSLKPKAAEEAVVYPTPAEASVDQPAENEKLSNDVAPDIVVKEATPKRRGRPSLKPKATEETIKKPTSATPKHGRPSRTPKADEESPDKDVDTEEKYLTAPAKRRGRPSKVAPQENSPTSLQSSEAQPSATPKRRGRPSLAQKAKGAEEDVEVKTPKRRGRKSLKPKEKNEEEHTYFHGEASGAPTTTPKRRSVVPSNEAFLSPVQSQESESESANIITAETESSPVISKRGRKSNATKAEESVNTVEAPVATAEKNTRKSLLLMSEESAEDAVVKSQAKVFESTKDAEISDYPFLLEASKKEETDETAKELDVVEQKSKRRGRKATQDTPSASSTEVPLVVATPSKSRAKKEVAATPVRRSRRVSTLETPAKKEAKKEEKTTAKRRPRARKVEDPEESSPAKQAKIDEPEYVEAIPAEVSAAPRRTRRNSKTETAEVKKEEPAKKLAKRRKRDASASAESSDNEAATKPTRGRKAKKENVAETEKKIGKSPKRPGRKSKKQEDQAAEDLPVEKSPVKKPGRKLRKVEEEVAEETVVESPKKKAGRPKKVKEADSSKEQQAESPKKKTGRPKKTKAAESSDDTKDSEAEQAEVKPKRGRKAKVEPKIDLDTSESPEETEVTSETPKRGRKAKAHVEPVVEAEKPKRSRPKKTSSDESSQERSAQTKTRSTRSKVPVVVPEIEMEHVETVSCLKKSKKALKSTVSFQETSEPEEECAVEAKPAEKPAKKATTKKASQKTTKDAEEKPKVARGGRKKAAPAATEESETPSTRSSRSTRSQKQI